MIPVVTGAGVGRAGAEIRELAVVDRACHRRPLPSRRAMTVSAREVWPTRGCDTPW